MKVEKCTRATAPGYPSRRQFSQYRLLAGVAAIGLGAVVGRGGDMRLGGEMAAEPRESKAPSAKEATILGKMRADPAKTCTTTNAPAATTNQAPAVATSTNKSGNAANPLPMTLGIIRANPK